MSELTSFSSCIHIQQFHSGNAASFLTTFLYKCWVTPLWNLRCCQRSHLPHCNACCLLLTISLQKAQQLTAFAILFTMEEIMYDVYLYLTKLITCSWNKNIIYSRILFAEMKSNLTTLIIWVFLNMTRNDIVVDLWYSIFFRNFFFSFFYDFSFYLIVCNTAVV